MKTKLSRMKFNIASIIFFLVPLVLFWVVLLSKIPYSFSQYFYGYSSVTFLLILGLYYLCFRLPDPYNIFASFSLSMLLFALTLSFKWTSGFSDNGVIGGLLPYKDGKNYYAGAQLILNGLPMINAGQATERPLFPGFMSALLLFTGQNLKITLAIIVQLAGIGLYLSARQIRNSIGVLSATLYAAFMYFYIQPLIGYILSESLGFTLGCVAFCLIWRAAHNLKRFDLTVGLITLLMAVSARAGAFLIFPALILWIGWIFRGGKRFSMKAATYAFIIVLTGYFLLNRSYAQLLGIPPGSAFANFSYAIYGQIRGGTGWHSAIEVLGTHNPSIVYRAALEFFLKHPISVFIGFAKSYRDFFLPGNQSIFPFRFNGWESWFDVIMWVGVILLFVRGLIRIFGSLRENYSSLMAAGFIGVFLSIPFLPPIDGGARFYASTMPFFFAPLVVSVSRFSKSQQEQGTSDDDSYGDLIISRSVSLIVFIAVLIVPILIYIFSREPAHAILDCPANQRAYEIELHPMSYIDLIKDESTKCGAVPEVCLDDFEKNNIELATDDFYQNLISHAGNSKANLRLIPAIDLIENNFHYFYLPIEKVSGQDSSKLITGCGVEIKTKNQSIFQVKSVFPNTN